MHITKGKEPIQKKAKYCMIPTSGKGKTMKTIKRSVTAGVRVET